MIKNTEVKSKKSEDKQFTNEISENKAENVRDNEKGNVEIESKDTNIIKDRDISLIGNKDSDNLDNTEGDKKSDNNLKVNMPIVLAEKKNKGSNNKKNENKNKGSNNKKNENKNKNKNNIYMTDEQEENDDDTIVQFFEGDEGMPMKEGDTVLWQGLLSDSSAIR